MTFTRYRSSSRPAPVLPDPDTLPFPANIIRQCRDCDLCSKGEFPPVPGDGPAPADVMFVGQNPGLNEARTGKPFIGQAGQQFDSLLFSARVPREDCYVTNRVKGLTPNNRELRSPELTACKKWLDLELSVVNPKIIVAMGASAVRYFLPNSTDTMEHLHGKPIPITINGKERLLLPTYHPAAALHQTTLLRQLKDDFEVLRGIYAGRDASDYVAHDEYPNPDYRMADTPRRLKQLMDEIHDYGEFAIDTETIDYGKVLWSAQVSTHPGSGWFIPIPPDKGHERLDTTTWPGKPIVHYYLNDIKYLVLNEEFWDTMVLAYLVGNTQGLKELASRLCGLRMVTYKEMVRSGQRRLSLEYLQQATKHTWPDPPRIEETKWDNKKGGLITKVKKPWHISRKIASIIALADDDTVDLMDKWEAIDKDERAVVESVLGRMPESSLADIPFEQAFQYSVRDSDATIRVKHKLMEQIDRLGLGFVASIDHGILPMVNNMMENGLPADPDYFRSLSEQFLARMQAKAVELSASVGHAFNPSSSQQVAAVVYGELGFRPTAFTPTKEISTDDSELKKCKLPDGGVHPVIKGIINYRQLNKLKGTYSENMARSAHMEGGCYRVHTKINTTRVETGRLSSSKTEDGEGGNFQNIPARSKDGKLIKAGFKAPNGKRLFEADYSQIEMVCLAHLSNCKRLIEIFMRGGDPHTEMAMHIFNVPFDTAKQDKYRYPMKRVNFGIAYLIGAQGLSNQIQEYISDLEMTGDPVEIEPWDEATCQKFLDEWYKLNPEVKVFQDDMGAMARRRGYVKDLFGRIRYIPEVYSPIQSVKEAGLRQAANMPVTATAQEIIKSAMIRLWTDLPLTPWTDDVRWLMQIHDSLVGEVTDKEEVMRPFLKWMVGVMTSVVKLRVPVKADVKVGYDWANTEKYRLD